MAAKRGRGINSYGQLFGPLGNVDGAYISGSGRPVPMYEQGVPTMQGYRDRPGKWNMEFWRDQLRKLKRQRQQIVLALILTDDPV